MIDYESEINRCIEDGTVVDPEQCKKNAEETLSEALETCENPTPPPEPTCLEIAATTRQNAEAQCGSDDSSCFEDAKIAFEEDIEECDCKAEAQGIHDFEVR